MILSAKKTALSLLVLAFCFAGAAQAQYSITGNTPGGGKAITANGSVGNLSVISSPVSLSPGGYDSVTINAGAIALASGMDTLEFTTSNNTLLNNGTVFGSAGLNPGDTGYNAVSFLSLGSLSNETVTNNSTITGGAGAPNVGADAGPGGAGVAFQANGTLTNATLINHGSIRGGDGADSTTFAGYGGPGVIFTFGGNASGLSVYNYGSILGGMGGVGGVQNSDGGVGIDMFSASAATLGNVTIFNAGTVRGGDAGVGGSNFFGAGGGAFEADPDGALYNVTFTNNGSFIGGKGAPGFNGGQAIGFVSFNSSISNFNLLNNGLISGGPGGASANGGGSGLNGVSLQAEGGPLTNITLINNGQVLGGQGGDGGIGAGKGGGFGGYGFEIGAKTGLVNMTFVNNGVIAGGNGGNATFSGIGEPGVDIDANGVWTNVKFTNNGLITGGNGGVGANAGEAVEFFGSAAPGSVITLTNWGVIAGGNASGGGTAGFGFRSAGDGIMVNNWGSISAGTGVAPVAISFFGSNNVVNLNGHSSVNGLIQASNGNANSNHLNLNFTGLSPAAIAALKAQLNAQGVLNGLDSTGSFTVRGVNYSYDPLVIGFNVSSYQLQGLTPNQQAVGTSLDSAAVNPAPGSPLFNLFNAVDQSGNVPGALESLSPQKYQAYADLAISNASATVQNVDARLNNLRDGSESIDTTGVGGGADHATAGYAKGDDGNGGKNIVTPAPERRWGFFATGEGIFFRGNTRDIDLQSAKANTAGTVAGVDGKVGEHAVVGALFAYDNADATLGGDGSHATIESYSGGLYGAWHQDGLFINGLAAYTRNDYTSTRNILIPGFSNAAAGSTNGNQYTANLDGGYDWHATDRLTVGPVAGLQYVHLDVDGFNETGAGAAGLGVGSQGMDSLQSRIGGRIDYHLLTTASSSFAAELHAAWQHEYLNDSRGISGSFIGSGLAPFSVQTSSPLRDSAVVGLGLNFTFHERLTLFAGYELQYWRASYFQQTVNGGARISF